MVAGRFEVISEVGGNSITAIITPERGRVLMATEQGNVYECRLEGDGSRHTRPYSPSLCRAPIANILGPLPLTSLLILRNNLFAGSLSRGALSIQDGLAREMDIRPSPSSYARWHRTRTENSGWARASGKTIRDC